MKVSLNSIKQFTHVDLSIDELVVKINAQLGGVEEVINLGERYIGATIVRIISCEDHPNADRLHICMVDDGGVTKDVERDADGYVQVVCGAPNARAGIFVVWLPPGSTVPTSFSDNEPFVLGARELRGKMSNGMLASPKELGIGESHDGILEIDENEWSPIGTEIVPGLSFARAYGLDEYVIDIENKMFTHRPDCFGVLGVAREIAGIQQHTFSSPEWYTAEMDFVSGYGLELSVTNEATEAVPRFMAVAIKNVEVKPSPLWLQCELIRLGSKPINNIVDVTNYCMLLTGQPLHAYDYDKIGTKKLSARFAHDGERASLLNGKTIALTGEDVVVTNGETVIGLGGVMGGGDSEVSNETKNIILECATFDMYKIRKTSMRHGLFTDAVTRFNKGQSPLQNTHVMSVALASLKDVAGGEVASQLFDASAELRPTMPISLDTSFINERLGTALGADEAAKLLANVEVETIISKNTLTVKPPFWRTDIELPEDIVEEVGRLYGFDNLPRELPVRSMMPATKNPLFESRRIIRDVMSRAGANEILTYSFVHENLVKRSSQDITEAFKLSNALSPDLQYYRLSVLPSLLEKVNSNIRAGHDEFLLYEIGKAHGKSEIDEDGLPKELGRVAGVFAANKKVETYYTGAPFYVALRYVRELLALTASQNDVSFRTFDEAGLQNHVMFTQLCAPFDANRSAVVYVGQKPVGVVGEMKSSVRKGMKLPDYTAGFELFLSTFDEITQKSYQPLSRFPGITQDISLKVSEKTKFADVASIVDDELQNLSSEYVVQSSVLNIYQAEENDTKTITFRIKVTNYEKTLKDSDVSAITDQIAKQAAQKINAKYV